MADEDLRAKERRAQAGGLEERAAWLTELRRSGDPRALAAEALSERIEASLTGLRRRVDRSYDSYRSQGPVAPCPELPLARVVSALESALQARADFGYGFEVLARFWPSKDVPYSSQCGVLVFAARLGGVVTLGVDFAMAAKPSPGTTWSQLSPWRDSLKPTTKERKVRAWVEAGGSGGLWETLPLEEATLWVDLYRLPRGELGVAPKAPRVRKGKVTWRGLVRGVQPRLRLGRPQDEDEFFPAGYALRLEGKLEGEVRAFSVGIGPGAQNKHAIGVGDQVSGLALPVDDPFSSPVEFYRVSKLKVLERGQALELATPPFRGPCPALEDYRGLAPRRLARSALLREPCGVCHWGSRVQVEGLPDYEEPLLPACFGPADCSAFVAPE